MLAPGPYYIVAFSSDVQCQRFTAPSANVKYGKHELKYKTILYYATKV